MVSLRWSTRRHVNAVVLVLGVCTGGAWAQLEGCSTGDMQKLSSSARSLMGCVGLGLGDALSFMRSMNSQQVSWMNSCSADYEEHSDDCLRLLESLTQQAATQPSSVPAKFANNIFKNPPGVVNCMAGLSGGTPASAFSASCTDGKMIAQGLAMAARLAPFLNSIQPWRLPPQLDGCGLSDMLHANLAVLPVVECLNLNVTQIMDMMATAQGSGGSAQVSDTVISSAISCLYDPHGSNSDCFYLANFISVQIQAAPFMTLDQYTQMVLTDFPQACRCTQGFSQSSELQQIAPQCQIRDVFKLVQSLETTCSYQTSVQSALKTVGQGCTDTDIVRLELMGLQVLDCIGADGASIYSTSQVTNDVRIDTMGACASNPGTHNKACISLVDSIADIAAARPDSLEAKLTAKLSGAEGPATCNCFDGVYRSQIAKSLKPSCQSGYSIMTTLRDNLDTCMQLTHIPASQWSSALEPPPPHPSPDSRAYSRPHPGPHTCPYPSGPGAQPAPQIRQQPEHQHQP